MKNDKQQKEGEGLWEIPLTAIWFLGNAIFKQDPNAYTRRSGTNDDIGNIDVDKLNNDSKG